jgi:uncharacterized SAM-binding protein YcdF (DUF218 family)
MSMSERQISAAQISGRTVTLRRALVLLLVLAILILGVAGFRGLGNWLVREDPLAHADAIVVLSGGMPYRAEGAADLYRADYAPEVWITRPVSPAATLDSLGIQFVGEEQYSRDVLLRDGVPANAIHILPGQIANTQQEVEEISRVMGMEGKRAVIIVTSPEHTRRVRALWVRLAGENQKAIVRAAPEDPFDRKHWWRDTADTYAVVRELLGLLNVWTGLRIHPVRTPANSIARR